MMAADVTRVTRSLGELLPLAFGLQPASAPGEGDACRVIAARLPGFRPFVGIVLGSGLGAAAETMEVRASIGYDRLEGFPVPSTPGHAGRLDLGHLAGVPMACLHGRAHLYEGHPASAVLAPVRTLRALGCGVLLLTNAAGSLRAEVGPGSLVAVSDHLNLTGTNPLVGRNDEAIGPRFPDMHDLYDPFLRQCLAEAALIAGVPLSEGIYAGVLGPTFETPAEVRAIRALGADLVGCQRCWRRSRPATAASRSLASPS